MVGAPPATQSRPNSPCRVIRPVARRPTGEGAGRDTRWRVCSPDYRKLLLTLPEIAELDRKAAAELFDHQPAAFGLQRRPGTVSDRD